MSKQCDGRTDSILVLYNNRLFAQNFGKRPPCCIYIVTSCILRSTFCTSHNVHVVSARIANLYEGILSREDPGFC